MRINLGCGSDRRDGYLNIDAFTPEADLRSDLTELGLRPGTADEVYCSHVLEHLSEPQLKTALREIRRVLKVNQGKAVLLVPDFAWCLENWLALPESQKWGWAIDTIFGNQNHEGELHRTGFTLIRMRRLLEDAGFSAIQVSTVFSHGMRSIRAEATADSGARKHRIALPRRAVNKIVMAKYRLKGLGEPRPSVRSER